MNQPLLTIIMPVYNSESFLEEAINSILNQTYGYFKFLISDNCSNDSSFEICKKFYLQDKRIDIFKQQSNLGSTLNIKFLLEKVNTRFCMIAASDDFLSNDWLEKLMQLQHKKECIAYGDTIFINKFGKYANHQSAISNQTLKGSQIIRRINFFFKSGFEAKMIPLWGIYPTKILNKVCLKEKKRLLSEKNTYCLDTRIVFEAIKFLEIHQRKNTFLYKRIHENSDSRNPQNVNVNANKIKNPFLITLKAIFRIHQSEALWNDLTLTEKFLVFPFGIFIYPKSILISIKRLFLFFFRKFIKKL